MSRGWRGGNSSNNWWGRGQGSSRADEEESWEAPPWREPRGPARRQAAPPSEPARSGSGAAAQEGGKKKHRRKKRKREDLSSASSSSSSSSYDWRQEVWRRGFQGLGCWPMLASPAAFSWGRARYGGGQMAQWQAAYPQQQASQQGHDQGHDDWDTWDTRQAPPAPPPRKRSRFDEDPELRQDRFEERSEKLAQAVLEPLQEAIIDVPRNYIAKVIGKGGQQICVIRKHSGAQVDARQQTTDPCPVRVLGTAQAIEKARDMIWDLVELATLRTGTILYIARAKIGKVIGIRGAQIHEIQMTTGAKVDVDKDVDPCKITIGGDPDKVEHAKRMVLTLAMEAADGESEYLDLPKNVTGAVLGVRGARLRELQASSGARIDVDKTQPNVCRVRLAGTPDQIETAKQLVLLAAEAPRPPEAVVPTSGEGSPQALDGLMPAAVCTIPVPAGQGGKLIGKGGAVVQALQQESGARIWVDCETSEVRVTGEKEAVETARNLVQAMIAGDLPTFGAAMPAIEPPQAGGMAGMLTMTEGIGQELGFDAAFAAQLGAPPALAPPAVMQHSNVFAGQQGGVVPDGSGVDLRVEGDAAAAAAGKAPRGPPRADAGSAMKMAFASMASEAPPWQPTALPELDEPARKRARLPRPPKPKMF